MQKTLVLTDVKLFWNNKTRTYQSVGSFAVQSVLSKWINKKVEGYLEITRLRTGDLFDLFIKLDNGEWYYFKYSRLNMFTLSSNRDYITLIQNTKDSDRELDVPRGEPSYNYMICPDQLLNQFKYRFEKSQQPEPEKEKKESVDEKTTDEQTPTAPEKKE